MSPSVDQRRALAEKRRVRAEAAAWIARLHGPERNCAMEEGFRRWLAERPAHAAEFERATDAWNETAGIPLPAPRALSARHRTAPSNRRAWPAAVGLLGCLLVAAWIAHILDHSVVTTRVGEQKTISLPDGSRVSLNTNSRIVVLYDQQKRVVILRYGEAYFQVVHNQARPFIVRAGTQKVIDIGTSFMVRRNAVGNGSLSVTVIEGRVAVVPLELADILPKPPSFKVVFVSAGNRLLLRPHELPSLLPESAERATAWLRGELVFNNTTLGDAVAQLNRYNSVKITIGSAQLKKIPVAGVFRVTASESFARAVAEAHDLDLVVRADELLLEPRNNHPNDRPNGVP